MSIVSVVVMPVFSSVNSYVHKALLIFLQCSVLVFTLTLKAFDFAFLYLSSELDLQMCTDSSYLCIAHNHATQH